MEEFRSMLFATASQLLAFLDPGAGERTRMFPDSKGGREPRLPNPAHTRWRNPLSSPLLLLSGCPKHLNIGPRTEDVPNPELFQTTLGSEGRFWGAQEDGIEVGKEGICQIRVMI